MTQKSDGRTLANEEILQGFLYSYRQLDVNALKVFEASTNLYALIELLITKGIIGVDELDQRKRVVENRMTKSFQEAEIGVIIQDPTIDKYTLEGEIEVDCYNRHQICKSVCCKLALSLSWQDIQEGVRWDVGRPFLCAKGADGYCVHSNRETNECMIYQGRPAPCRVYDCSDDDRIWIDFEKKEINPEVFSEETFIQSEELLAKVGTVPPSPTKDQTN